MDKIRIIWIILICIIIRITEEYPDINIFILSLQILVRMIEKIKPNEISSHIPDSQILLFNVFRNISIKSVMRVLTYILRIIGKKFQPLIFSLYSTLFKNELFWVTLFPNRDECNYSSTSQHAQFLQHFFLYTICVVTCLFTCSLLFSACPVRWCRFVRLQFVGNSFDYECDLRFVLIV